MSSSDDEVTHHPDFYLQGATHIFRVENTLYKLQADILARNSQVFNDLFLLPLSEASPSQEGMNDDNPIRLDCSVKKDMFDLFCGHTHGRPRAQYTTRELSAFLEFCHKYQCDTITNFLVNRIWEQRFYFHPADFCSMAQRYSLPRFFEFAFKRLVKLPLTQITREYRESIGSDVFAAVAYAKAILDKHCRIVAAEPPDMLHADGCVNPDACATDWRTVWWNGMGRLLLDGRNPQPYEEAFKRFKEMHFGRVSRGCRRRMLDMLDVGSAFDQVDNIISDIYDRLARTVFPSVST